MAQIEHMRKLQQWLAQGGCLTRAWTLRDCGPGSMSAACSIGYRRRQGGSSGER